MSRWFPRSVVLTVLTVLVGVLGAGACSQPSAPVASGKVSDARNGLALAGVTVTALSRHGATLTTTTDPGGHFALDDVAVGAEVTATLANYAGITTGAGPGLVLRLDPLPVRGVVTSVLTGMGLVATVSGTATAADGTVTLYRLGPGARLAIAAPLYAPTAVAVRADRTFSVQLQPSLDPVAAVSMVPGFSFRSGAGTPTTPVVAQLHDDPTISALNPALASGSMVSGTTTVAGITVIALDAASALSSLVRSQILLDAASYPGGVSQGGATTTTIGGVSVQMSASRQGMANLAWQQAGTFFILSGQTSGQAAMNALATAIIAADG